VGGQKVAYPVRSGFPFLVDSRGKIQVDQT